MSKFRRWFYDHKDVRKEGVLHWCPGCETAHSIVTLASDGGVHWKWNGSETSPTIAPSVRLSVTKNGDNRTTCHYFIREGLIEFCADSPHSLAGKSVPLPDFPEDYDDGGSK